MLPTNRIEPRPALAAHFFGIPAANQRGAPLVIKSTGFVQVGGTDGDNVSSILKSPSTSSDTRPEVCAVPQADGEVLQNSSALTICLPFVPITLSAGRVGLPPARSRPRPSTVMCTLVSTTA